MTDDFVTRLGAQLSVAAERDARRGSAARTLTAARRRSPALAAAVALIAVLAAVAAATLWLRAEEVPPRPAVPVVVAELDLTPNPEGLAGAFGSVWIPDRLAGTVVRVDPASRQVLARIPVRSGGDLFVQPVADELWATTTAAGRNLVRIDPATNAVRARTPLRTPAGRPFSPLGLWADGDIVWALSPEGALRLDPGTGAGVRLARAQPESSYWALGSTALWSLGIDGRLYRMDARTGAAEGSIPSGLPGTAGILADGEALYAGTRDGTMARLDPRTGAEIWHRDLGDEVGAAEVRDGVAWVHVTRAGQPDRLVSLDVDTGATRTSTPLTSFGSTGLLPVGDEIWIDTAAGGTIVVGHATR